MKERVVAKAKGAGRFVRKYWPELLQLFGLILAAVINLIPADAMAWSTPSSGSFAYDVYDIAINKLAKGPIGFVGAAGMMVGAVVSAVRGSLLGAGLFTIGAGILYKADSLVSSLGFCI